jgi:HK97 family phage portal protein
MNLFGIQIVRKAAVPPTTFPVPEVRPVSNFMRQIMEAFPGAWQRNFVLDPVENLLATSTVYAVTTLIANDVSKLRPKLVQQDDNGIWTEVQSSAFSPVLRKPNRYQTRIQFLNSWVLSKLIWGNTYVLKQRDDRGAPGKGVVTQLYVLDPKLVKPLVTSSGDIWYQLNADNLTGITGQITVPASEIIHDRAACLWHPLVGVPPLYAAAYSGTQSNRIQTFAGKFFENMSRPSGILTAPDVIDDATALRLKTDFETNFSGTNLGRLLVAGDGLKYEALSMPANQAQMFEQLKWTGEDICRPFHMPLYKVGLGPSPTYNNIGALQQDYFDACLQELIENIELLLDEGLGLVNVPGQTLGTELDTDNLLRMDPLTRADRNEKGIRAGYLKPNEARKSDNLAPVEGGDTPYMQVQNFPLSVLVNQPPPGSVPPAAAPAVPAEPAVGPKPASKGIDELSAFLEQQKASRRSRPREGAGMGRHPSARGRCARGRTSGRRRGACRGSCTAGRSNCTGGARSRSIARHAVPRLHGNDRKGSRSRARARSQGRDLDRRPLGTSREGI